MHIIINNNTKTVLKKIQAGVAIFRGYFVRHDKIYGISFHAKLNVFKAIVNFIKIGFPITRTALRFAEMSGHGEVACILRFDPAVHTIQESAAAGMVKEVWALMRQVL